ncbi:MAG: ribonucleoside-triphosphate reductase [Candidatus Humimicrobiaceae bacterium]
MQTIKEALLELGQSLPAKFTEAKNDVLWMTYVVAERKAFLSKQKLFYRCRIKIDDNKKALIFFEILSEVGSGLSTGGGFDSEMSSGFGFKAEKTTYRSGGREGTIEEQTVLFGKKYEYNFDYKKIREDVKAIAEKFGYGFEITLRESSIN